VAWSAHRILEVSASKPVSVFYDVLLMQVTAKRLLLSKQTIPHYYLSLDTHVDKLLKLRAELNAVLESSKTKDAPPKKISLNDFVIKVSILFLHLGPYPSKQR
jgi:pyruvate dehydrogenase E2 component (dihydrolipoamide acetyltransferase)